MDPHIQLFEVLMLICFGGSWPFAIVNTWRSKSAEGKSIVFLCLVLIGYLAGIIAKLMGSGGVVIWFYAVNGSMVLTEIVLWIKYAGLQRLDPRPLDSQGYRS